MKENKDNRIVIFLLEAQSSETEQQTHSCPFLSRAVSLTLCEIPAPEQELVDKYNDLKATFLKRLANAYNKAASAAKPYVDQASTLENAKVAQDALETLQQKPELAQFQKVME